jgi:hypothetical protein
VPILPWSPAPDAAEAKTFERAQTVERETDKRPRFPVGNMTSTRLTGVETNVEAQLANLELVAHQVMSGVAKGFISPTSEPTAAFSENQILVTGNWFGARIDVPGGAYTDLDAYGLFDLQGPLHEDLCCDQVAYKVRGRQLLVWLMQGAELKKTPGRPADQVDTNFVKLFVAKSPKDFAERHFVSYALPSEIFGANRALDFSNVGATDEHLFVATNTMKKVTAAGKTEREFESGVVFRVPLNDLKNGSKLRYRVWCREGLEHVEPKLVQGATDTMTWVSALPTKLTDHLTVRTWPDMDVAPSGEIEIGVETWTPIGARACEGGSDNWLGALDPAASAAWEADGFVGFAWHAGPDSNYKCPHIRVAVVTRQSLINRPPGTTVSPSAQPHLFNANTSFAYLSVAPNLENELGVSVAFARQNTPPSHAVGFLQRDKTTGTWEWKLAEAQRGAAWPKKPVWGDYLTIGADENDGWVTAGQFLDGAGDPQVDLVRFRKKK